MATTHAKTAEPPSRSPSPPATAPAPPPLENGDRLNRVEFERRYDAMPELKKAELIEGIVYMGSPVSHERHGKPHFHMIGWLAQYWMATPGVEGGDNSSLRLDLDNMPQPDIFLYILPESGGTIRIREDGFVEGAPELIAEVASSSVSYDLHAKLQVYRRNGVREYIVWRVRDQAIDWFLLREGEYERNAVGADGLHRSEAFPGLWLDANALARGDRIAISQAVQRGLATPEHAEFVDRLKPAPRPGA